MRTCTSNNGTHSPKSCINYPIHLTITRISKAIGCSLSQFAEFAQNLVHLSLMSREIIDKVVPHLGFVLMLFVAIPCPVSDGERSTRLKHESDGILRNLHLWWRLSGCGFEFLVRNAVGYHSALEGYAARLKGIGSTSVFPIYQTHELRSHVSVIVWWSVGVRCYIPSWRED